MALVGAACSGGSTPATPAKSTATTAAKASATTAATPAATPKAAATTAPTPAGSPKAAAPAATTGLKVADTSLGKVIVDNNNMTLYTFKNDPTDGSKSACNGNCAAIWPPAFTPETGAPTKAAEITGAVATVNRDDGTKMIAYKGQPLYRYAQDQAPGDTKGEGVGGNWTVARP
ncbi:MAG: hypothetical protein U0360_05485 [Dehalococcoidia bacterium]